MEINRESKEALMKEASRYSEASLTQAKVLETNFTIQGEYFSGSTTKDSDTNSFVNTCEITDLYDGFNWLQYYEFVFYHVLFLFVTGPLTGVLLTPITGKYLVRNMSFTGMDWKFSFQALTWLSWIVILFANIFYFNNDILFPLQLFIMINTMLVRILSVSVKYGTFSKCKINRWRTEYIPQDEIVREYVLKNWASQDEELVEQEIRKGMHKEEIDSAVFQFSFLGELSAEVATLLRLNTKYYKERTTSFFPLRDLGEDTQEHQSEFYHGFSIMLYWIEKYKKELSLDLSKPLFFSSILRALLPMSIAVIMVPESYTMIGNYSGVTIVAYGLIQMLAITFNVLNFFFNASLLTLYLKDLKRKSFFMQQLSYLIAPKRFDGFQSVKYFPTINILDPKNIKSWISLRKLSMYYGKRMDSRLQNDLVGYLLYYIILLLLVFFDFIPFVNSSTNVLLRITIIYEISLMVIIALLALLKAADVNNFFVIHKNILMENRIFYLDFEQKAKYYLEEENPTASYLYKFCSKRLKLCPLSNLGMKKQHLKNLEEVTKDTMDDLDYTQRTDPLRIFGIPASRELLVSMAIGIFSLVVSTVDSIIVRDD